MTDTYLRSLGFAPTRQEPRTNRADFGRAWRYQYDHDACDGTSLFIEHPLGINLCRLSALPAPISAQDVFASVELNDLPAFEAAIKAFYAAHGGMGPLVPAGPAHASFGPYRREH